MRKENSFKEFVLDQLVDLPGVSCRAMFGGYGLYLSGTFFAVLSKDCVYFKTDAESRQEFVARDMQPFQPGDNQILKNYYEVPPDILEDSDLMAEWAKRAAQVKTLKKSTPKKKGLPTD